MSNEPRPTYPPTARVVVPKIFPKWIEPAWRRKEECTRVYLMNVGENLRCARLHERMSLADMAAIGGVCAQTQSRYEAGKSAPNAMYLGRVLAFLSPLSAKFLLFGHANWRLHRELNRLSLIDLGCDFS